MAPWPDFSGLGAMAQSQHRPRRHPRRCRNLPASLASAHGFNESCAPIPRTQPMTGVGGSGGPCRLLENPHCHPLAPFLQAPACRRTVSAVPCGSFSLFWDIKKDRA